MTTPGRRPSGPAAWFGGTLATGLSRVTDDPDELDSGGWWAVLVTFEGERRFYRFDHRTPSARPPSSTPLPPREPWVSSLDRPAYERAVGQIRDRIREGDVYQVNLCRTLSTPQHPDDDPWALAAALADHNPAPWAGVIDAPASGDVRATRLVTASPELGLARDGLQLTSSPIKGTAPTAAELLPKDTAENVMIVDLVRNDLQRVCEPGTVAVPALLTVEHHPGLVHLVSTVSGTLRPGTGWRAILEALTPAGSVSGAPKSSALTAIRALEPVERGPYCGLVGFVDADAGCARLAVAIRTFWWDDGRLHFGTGAGITWGSDPRREWDETELKARHLVRVAGGMARQGQP
ncbi:chorismate-binding protein [Spongisporangium articulatum]|uniref:Chorismate-binding protein n=1 Tax=Spongisporangium articulatum TaxID=3362603 RepID=A0ABW8ATB0_9ACTN